MTESTKIPFAFPPLVKSGLKLRTEKKKKKRSEICRHSSDPAFQTWPLISFLPDPPRFSVKPFKYRALGSSFHTQLLPHLPFPQPCLSSPCREVERARGTHSSPVSEAMSGRHHSFTPGSPAAGAQRAVWPSVTALAEKKDSSYLPAGERRELCLALLSSLMISGFKKVRVIWKLSKQTLSQGYCASLDICRSLPPSPAQKPWCGTK